MCIEYISYHPALLLQYTVPGTRCCQRTARPVSHETCCVTKVKSPHAHKSRSTLVTLVRVVPTATHKVKTVYYFNLYIQLRLCTLDASDPSLVPCRRAPRTVRLHEVRMLCARGHEPRPITNGVITVLRGLTVTRPAGALLHTNFSLIGVNSWETHFTKLPCPLQ